MQCNKRSYMYANVHVPDTRVVRMSKQKKMANGLSVILDRFMNETIAEWRIRIQIAVVEDRSSYQLLSWMLMWTWCPSLPF